MVVIVRLLDLTERGGERPMRGLPHQDALSGCQLRREPRAGLVPHYVLTHILPALSNVVNTFYI